MQPHLSKEKILTRLQVAADLATIELGRELAQKVRRDKTLLFVVVKDRRSVLTAQTTPERRTTLLFEELIENSSIGDHCRVVFDPNRFCIISNFLVGGVETDSTTRISDYDILNTYRRQPNNTRE